MGKWIFVVFLLITAIQDLRKSCVEWWIYMVFGGLACLKLVCEWVQGQPVDWLGMACSLCLGLGLLGCSMMWSGGLGLGDGCFFLITGLLLGFWENFALLCYGLCFCSAYCLVLFVWNQLHWQKNMRRLSVPFLPFLLAPGMWIAFGWY